MDSDEELEDIELQKCEDINEKEGSVEEKDETEEEESETEEEIEDFTDGHLLE